MGIDFFENICFINMQWCM